MKKSNIIWGIIFVLVGVVLILDRLDIFKFDIFFSGWWTLFIIIPSFVGLLTDREKTGNLIFLIIGISLLLVMQDVITFEILWKLFFPIIFVLIGLSLIFKDSISRKVRKEIKKINKKDLKFNEYNAIFAGEDLNFSGNSVSNMELSAIFGGMNIDLREAKIPNELLIEATSIFGGIDIFVPDDVCVKTTGTNIFGGNTNKKINNDSKKTIYIESLCLFGGIDIK